MLQCISHYYFKRAIGNHQSNNVHEMLLLKQIKQTHVVTENSAGQY